MAFQKDCLSKLQDVWLKRYRDPLLPSDGVLKFNKRFKEIPQDCVLSNVNHPENMELENEARTLQGRACSSTSIVVANKSWSLQRPDEDCSDEIADTESMCRCVENCYCSPGYTIGETVTRAETSESGISLVTSDKSLEFNSDSTHHRQNCDPPSAGKFREKLVHLIKTSYFEEVSSPFAHQLLLVYDYLNYFMNSEETDLFENFGSVLFKMMEEFLLLVNMDDELPDAFKNTSRMPQERFILLHLLSDWVGKEFHDLEGVIKENVETFKKDNITCIDSLPSAETIIKTLFPSFMRIFVTNWLGFQNEDSLLHQNSETSSMSDHCYTQVEKVKGQGSINYQLVQLILEFGSNCLISGIGHVVFSRLQIENNSDA